VVFGKLEGPNETTKVISNTPNGGNGVTEVGFLRLVRTISITKVPNSIFYLC
jgi:hypothetical protein